MPPLVQLLNLGVTCDNCKEALPIAVTMAPMPGVYICTGCKFVNLVECQFAGYIEVEEID